MPVSRLLLPRLLRPRLFSSAAAAAPAKSRKPLLYTLAALATAGAGATVYQSTSGAPLLNPETFTPYTLTAVTPIATTPAPTALLTLAAPAPPAPGTFSSTHIQSIEIKNPQVMIARHYTPLPRADGAGTIRLLVKREPGGEMSRYLFSLAAPAAVELRGPHDEYALPPAGAATRLLFLAGGTGIAPALQCAHKLLAASPRASMRILWAVRSRAESEGAALAEVERLKREFGGRLQVGVFCDAEGGVGRGVVRDGVEGWGAHRVVVSGPDGFVAYWAGKKGEWVGGRESQGPLGGVLSSVKGVEGVDVWKM